MDEYLRDTVVQDKISDKELDDDDAEEENDSGVDHQLLDCLIDV